MRLKPIECLSKFIVTLLQLINHVGNGFDVSRWKFQRWKQASLWITKKIRRQRIRGIIRRRSELNARGACRIIGGNSISCFWLRVVSEREIGNDSKTRKWVLYELKPRDVERRFFTCEQLIQRQQRKGFLHDCDWRWKVDILRQSQEEKILRYVRSIDLNINHGRTFMVRR